MFQMVMERLRCRLQGKLVFYDMVCMYEQVAYKKYASGMKYSTQTF